MFGIRELKESVCRLLQDSSELYSRCDINSDNMWKHRKALQDQITAFELRIVMLESPPVYKIGDVTNGITISAVEWKEVPSDAVFMRELNKKMAWHYFGVKKGSDKLIEVK